MSKIMKRLKLTYLLLMVLLAVVGCSTVDVVDPADGSIDDGSQEQIAISFGNPTIVDTSTKGVVIEDEATLATMGVYSYRTSVPWGEVKSGDQVTGFFNDYNDTYPIMVSYLTEKEAWSYGNSRYWPTDGTYLHFYAWAPYGRINRVFNQESGRPNFSHTLNGNAVENYDLMWANAQVDQIYSDEDFTGDVNIKFDHSLSRISLNVRVMVSSVETIEKDPTNIYAYERFGINGITFYDVIGEASVIYDETDWSPSWEVNTKDYTRLEITASQGNTLLEHYNSIRTVVGQVPKISESDVLAEEELQKLTFANVMMKEEDGTPHGIFLFPQTFEGDDADSPSAMIRVRVRHYSNYFVTVTEAKEVVDEYSDSYIDHIYCNTAGEVAVINFEDSTIEYAEYSALDDYMGDNNVILDNGEYKYQCVRKDEDGDIYSTGAVSLSEVFSASTGFASGLEAGQYVELYFTFDFTEGGDFDIPMTVTAEVYDWTDIKTEADVDEQLVIYCDTQSIDVGDGSVKYYTLCEADIIINSVTSLTTGVMVTASDDGTVVKGSTEHQEHSFSYSGVGEDQSATFEVSITKKSNEQNIVKQFTFVTNS